MSVVIGLIDSILISKGKKALKDIAKSTFDPRGENEKLLLKILKENKNTEYGKLYDFSNIKSIEEFKEKVPFSHYDTYEPYIMRMIKNKERNLITSYKVIQYAETSGSVGVQKKIPVTIKTMKLHQKYSIGRTKAMADKYYMETYGRHVPWEKGLNMVETELTTAEDGLPRGSVTGSVARRYKKLFKYFLEPPEVISFPIGGMNMNYMKARFALEEPRLVFFLSGFMTNFVDMLNYIKNNYKMICDDIENGTINNDVCSDASRPYVMKYVRKNPKRAEELRKIFQEGFDTPIIPRLWPNFAWACAIGTGGFSTYLEKFKKYSGDKAAIDYFVYAASEGMFAVATKMNEPKFYPITDSCFFEFLPADAPENAKDTLTLDELEEGKEYEVIITNQSGFYRYRIGDVIKVIGKENKMPLITFAYRQGQLASIMGEKTTEEHLNEAVRRLAKKLGVDINDYALYLDTNKEPGRYVLLIEPDSPLPIDKDGKYAEMFHEIMCEVNSGGYGFGAKVRHGISMPLVLIQEQQTHALWREYKMMTGSSGNQVKPVRVLDTPVKQKFFLGLVEEGQEIPNWNVYKK